MLCLRKHVSRHVLSIAAAVCNYKDFGRAGNHVDVNHAENLLLGFRYKSIAGTYDFINLRNCFSAVCQSRNCLCSACLENAACACDLGSGQDYRVDLAVSSRWSGDADFTAACQLGRNCVHENCGRVGSCTAGNVKADFFNRHYFLADDDAVLFADDEAVSYLLLVEGADVCSRVLENSDELRLNCCKSFVDFFLPYFQGGKVCAIELFAIFKEGFVAVCSYICDNFRHHAGNVFLHICAGKYFGVRNFSVLIYLNHFSYSSLARPGRI